MGFLTLRGGNYRLGTSVLRRESLNFPAVQSSESKEATGMIKPHMALGTHLPLHYERKSSDATNASNRSDALSLRA